MLQANGKLTSRKNVNKGMLTIRRYLMELDDLLVDKNRRHLAMADVLLMYVYTETFVVGYEYSEVTSPSIEVKARDMGQSVPRLKVMKYRKALENSDHHTQISAKIVNSTPLTEEEKAEAGTGSCKDDESVFTFQRNYPSNYILHQLLQWANNGQNTKEMDMFGCVTLPFVDRVYDCEVKYDKAERRLLYEHLNDPRKHCWPFSGQLRNAFNGPSVQNEDDVDINLKNKRAGIT